MDRAERGAVRGIQTLLRDGKSYKDRGTESLSEVEAGDGLRGYESGMIRKKEKIPQWSSLRLLTDDGVAIS